jgi:hypothetical protein
MKFSVLLILFIFSLNLNKDIIDSKQSIHLNSNKLLITDNRENIVSNTNNINNDISDVDFASKLEDAEKNLFKRLNTNNLKSSTINSKAFEKDFLPRYLIKKLNTFIDLKPNNTYAEITEKATFTLTNGVFSSINRKISLAGSSDSIIAFRLTSR